jgi:uncharacterized protein
MNSRIFEGWVGHRRMSPQRHEFRYPIYLMYLDLAELDEVFARRWLWSAKRPALAWFKREDHFGDPSKPLESEVRALVEKETGCRPKGRIALLTHLRYYGYCMNPVSFFYCWDAEGKGLDAIVAEVHNTPWGEIHCYVLDARTGCGSAPRLQFKLDKAFHVSPFMPMNQTYAWKFTTPGRTLGVHMESYEADNKLFDAAMHLKAVPISGLSLARVLIRYPFMTGRVIVAIYWQALRLWRKRTPFHSHPKHQLPKEMSR